METKMTASKLTISDLKPGDTAVIDRFSKDFELRPRLVEMGLLPGSEIRLVKAAPFQGPLELKVRNYYVSIRHQDARRIQVEK